MKKIQIYFCFFTLCILSLPLSANTNDNINKPIVVNNKEWTVTIELPANATTGYQWYLKSYDPDLIRPKSYRYSTNNDSKKIGQGGIAEFKLTVSKRFKSVPQLTEVSFIYVKPWNLEEQTKEKTITLLSTSA
ncbi:protease inhibitor I42 family protein [Thiotrichales bacterium 19S11-10]|nr:protease inhibitor I42 family protein [Thiotrichales bacterium 19S11-10]MCF6807444.1 protease inhibitor I42 family protein [Thiotrichales bacterium 19S9-11]MCF6811413.1 protease inhibitor I42 family protein [Thiotrichales bacterium 19S9-12]